jgi:hypothetical protein
LDIFIWQKFVADQKDSHDYGDHYDSKDKFVRLEGNFFPDMASHGQKLTADENVDDAVKCTQNGAQSSQQSERRYFAKILME